MERLQVGDAIRISVALLRQIYDESPDHVSERVELVDIRLEPDGTKLLILRRVEAE